MDCVRRNLANRPVAEKLAMLDALRDRTRTIRNAAKVAENQRLAPGPKPSGAITHSLPSREGLKKC